MLDNTPMYPVPPQASSEGVSHLQWLAGLAMQSIIHKTDGIPDSEAEREQISLYAYRTAQAMQAMENQLFAGEGRI